jgi:hypothetical protein
MNAETQISADHIRGKIIVEFAKPVSNMVLDPSLARAIARSLLKHADAIEKSFGVNAKPEVIS